MNKQAKQELEICIKDTQAFIKSLEECDELKLKSLINDKGTNHLYCFRNFKINNIYVDKILLKEIMKQLKETLKRMKVMLKNKKSHIVTRADLMDLSKD